MSQSGNSRSLPPSVWLGPAGTRKSCWADFCPLAWVMRMTIAIILMAFIVVASLASVIGPLIWFYIAAKNSPD